MAKSSTGNVGQAVHPSFIDRVSDLAFFTVIVVLTSIMMIGLAIIAPVVLALSALTAKLSRQNVASGWRSVSI